MALSQEHWNKALTALQAKAREVGVSPQDAHAMLELMRLHWELLSSEADLDAYLDVRELEELRAARTRQATELEETDAEIARRERPGPGPRGRVTP